MSNNANRFHVITGGPGSGKTAIIDALRSRGYSCSIEAGRGIIADHVMIDGPALPWRDPMLFSELMLSWEIRSYRIANEAASPVFFDRGVPDVLGYLHLMNLPVPDHMRKAAGVFLYNRKVFIAPPWKEIFRQDRERRQDFDEAIRTYHALATTYASLDYELVEFPRTSVEERLSFVLDHIAIDSAV